MIMINLNYVSSHTSKAWKNPFKNVNDILSLLFGDLQRGVHKEPKAKVKAKSKITRCDKNRTATAYLSCTCYKVWANSSLLLYYLILVSVIVVKTAQQASGGFGADVHWDWKAMARCICSITPIVDLSLDLY